MALRIGHGYDVHRVTEGNSVVLGGVRIECPFSLLAHSDGDVLLHALMDALLGACAEGDIGKLFPDSDMQYSGISSLELLRRVKEHIKLKEIHNIDITVIAQKPRLANHIDAIRTSVSSALGCDVSKVSVKATTEEGLGFTGRCEGIAAHAVVLIEI